MRRLGLWIASLALLAAAGCRPAAPLSGGDAPAKASEDRPGFPLTVEDDAGRKVTFERPPRRIVSLAPAHTETLYALGRGEQVIAADTYSDYPEEARAKAALNCWPRPPLERIVSLRPDLVLVLTQGDEFLRELDALRIPALKLFPETYEKTLDRLLLLGRVTDAEVRAEALVAGMRRRAEAVRRQVADAPPKRVLYELDASDPARPYVAGSGGFYGEVLRLAGGENVFGDIRGPSDQVSAEQVIARNPEVILLGDTRSPVLPQSPETVARRPGWSGIEAVRKKQVYAVDSDQITRPGPRLVEGLERVARLLHPERFR